MIELYGMAKVQALKMILGKVVERNVVYPDFIYLHAFLLYWGVLAWQS